MKPYALLFFLVLGLPLMASSPEETLVGRWSAPSLSRPETPIVIDLRADGTATEKIGDYMGNGRWKMRGDVAEILWDSEWVGKLSKSGSGEYRLETWKKGSVLTQKPDDDQPAKRLP